MNKSGVYSAKTAQNAVKSSSSFKKCHSVPVDLMHMASLKTAITSGHK